MKNFLTASSVLLAILMSTSMYSMADDHAKESAEVNAETSTSHNPLTKTTTTTVKRKAKHAHKHKHAGAHADSHHETDETKTIKAKDDGSKTTVTTEKTNTNN